MDSTVPPRRRGAANRATSRRPIEQHPPALTSRETIRIRSAVATATVTITVAGAGVAIAVFGNPIPSLAAATIVASLVALITGADWGNAEAIPQPSSEPDGPGGGSGGCPTTSMYNRNEQPDQDSTGANLA